MERCHLLFVLSLVSLALASPIVSDTNAISGEKTVVLVPQGMDENHAQRVELSEEQARSSPLPCVVLNAGVHSHGQTFSKGNFHYLCNNGTAEVIACVAEDGTVIQLGRVFVRNGIRHMCQLNADTVTYEQEAMCLEGGVHYNIGDSFKNGSFKLTCKRDGIAIEGCYLQNTTGLVLQLGESRIIGSYRHDCQMVGTAKARYTVNVVGCLHQDQVQAVGQVFTDRHVRYQCQHDGTLLVLGCSDERGLFIELGRDVLINNMVHRCYRVDRTTFYHQFECELATLADCIAHSLVRSRVIGGAGAVPPQAVVQE